MLGRSLKHRRAAILAAALLATVSAAAAAPLVDKTAPAPVTNVTREQLENLPTGRDIADLVRTCPGSTIPTVTGRPQTLIDGMPTSPSPSVTCIQPDDLRMVEVYTMHNAVRAEYGVSPLRWDPALQATASAYANQLAQVGQLVHASRAGRGIERENISQGLPNWSAIQLTDSWLKEKQFFTPGIFPNVSTTGDWSQVGHYSQIIWPTTTDIGCGMALGGGFSWLVCRYSPGGNKDGKPVGQVQTQQIAQGPASSEMYGRRASLFDLGIYGGGAWTTDWFGVDGAGEYNVADAFAELRLPLIADTSFYSLSARSFGEACPPAPAGDDNLFDLIMTFRFPDEPAASAASNTWPQVYDALGRYIYAGCTLDF